MNDFQNNAQPHRTAVTFLAAVGFVALVAAGIWLAVYSTRFVPAVVNRAGSAVVYLGSVLIPSPKSGLSIVPTPTASTTISFGETDVTLSSTSSPQARATATTTAIRSHWIPSSPVAVTTNDYYGLPDLAVAIEEVGYVSTDNADTIISAATIPANAQIAVKFRVTNIGTNVSGPWAMNISFGGTSANQTFSENQLVPSQPSEYIVRFSNISSGTDAITITIDPNHQLTETSTANNVASTTITVL